MRIVFMGTPEFAVPSLLSLIESGHEIIGVFTQPDKPKGRGHKLTPPPVKIEAEKYGIDVYQPNTLRDVDVINLISNLSPDVIIVVAYGKILPKEIIGLPRLGCVNVHGSLLPKYRGAAPIHWSIINGEKETGITTMLMDVGLDTGDMLLKASTNIGDEETTGELYERLSVMGAELIVKTIEQLDNDKLERVKQNDSESCYAPMLDKSLCEINWDKPAKDIHNFIRGLNPWPVAYTKLEGKKLKIYKTRVIDSTIDFNTINKPICVSSVGNKGKIISIVPFLVCCGDGKFLEILEVQYEGKKKMSSQDFLNGHKVKLNTILGE